MAEAADDAFTLQALLDFRVAAEKAGDEATHRRHLAGFAAYAEAFVSHVPRHDGEAVEALLLARYFTFLPLAPEEVTGLIRSDLEAALGAMMGGADTAEVLDPLWHVLAAVATARREGRWVSDEQDMPVATVTRNVLGWARGALLA